MVENIDSGNVATYIFPENIITITTRVERGLSFADSLFPSIPAAAPVESTVGRGPLWVLDLARGRDNGIDGQRGEGLRGGNALRAPRFRRSLNRPSSLRHPRISLSSTTSSVSSLRSRSFTL